MPAGARVPAPATLPDSCAGFPSCSFLHAAALPTPSLHVSISDRASPCPAHSLGRNVTEGSKSEQMYGGYRWDWIHVEPTTLCLVTPDGQQPVVDALIRWVRVRTGEGLLPQRGVEGVAGLASICGAPLSPRARPHRLQHRALLRHASCLSCQQLAPRCRMPRRLLDLT
jgi:hypothetical protein